MKNKRIAVTGGKGFLGTHLVRKLKERGYSYIFKADQPEYDLVKSEDIRRMYDGLRPDIVIHLAARVGGIGFNQQNPATLFYENLMMGTQLLHEAYLTNIEKFVAIGTICAYPKFTAVPFNEEDLWNGYPEETNAPYGLAKKMMLVQSQAYRQQYGFNSIFLLPVNLYGPGDNFNFNSSHVIPALIRKFYLATLLDKRDFDGIKRDFLIHGNTKTTIGDSEYVIKESSPPEDLLKVLAYYGISSSALEPSTPSVSPPASHLPPLASRSAGVSVWGTGTATREFFYVEDAAEAIILAMERYIKSDPVNLGAGFEISIKDLVDLIVELTAFKGHLMWDTTKPDGQPRRMLDTQKALTEFGFKAKTDLRQGLKTTIDWYRSITI